MGKDSTEGQKPQNPKTPKPLAFIYLKLIQINKSEKKGQMLISEMVGRSLAAQQPVAASDFRRNLALYPECAIIQEAADRYDCCDLAVASAAGRSFCYNEIIHEEGVFDDCDLGDQDINDACCEDLSYGDPYWAYDCQVYNKIPVEEVEQDFSEQAVEEV